MHHIIYWEHDGAHELNNLVLLCSRHHQRVHKHNETLTLHPNGQLDVVGLTGILRSSNPPPDIGHLFKRDALKPGGRCAPSGRSYGQRRIKRVLNALQDYDSTIKRIFTDQTRHEATLFAHRPGTRLAQSINIETLNYTYKTIDGVGILVKS